MARSAAMRSSVAVRAFRNRTNRFWSARMLLAPLGVDWTLANFAILTEAIVVRLEEAALGACNLGA